jgi:hypothetical protein
MSSFEARCPQCLFVSKQLGQLTPCLLHAEVDLGGLDTPADSGVDYDEPYTFGQLHPTVDCPGPFSLREYVRLQLLRTRLQANPSDLDGPALSAQARSLLRR